MLDAIGSLEMKLPPVLCYGGFNFLPSAFDHSIASSALEGRTHSLSYLYESNRQIVWKLPIQIFLLLENVIKFTLQNLHSFELSLGISEQHGL